MNRKPNSSMLIAALAVSCAGCVSLDVKPTTQGAGSLQREGLRYRLPFSQFKGIQVRRLTHCGAEPKIAVKFESVSIVSSPDWTRQYVVDMHSLSSVMKTSALKIERYPNGQLKSINAEADDKSAAVIGSAISTGLKFFTPIPDPLLGGGRFGDQACTTGAREALESVVVLTDKLAVLNNKIEQETSKLNGLTEQTKLAGGQADDTLKKKLVAASDTLLKSRTEHVLVQKDLDKALKFLTLSEEFVWPTDPADFGPKLMPLPDVVAEKWFEDEDAQMAMIEASCTQFWIEQMKPGAIESVTSTVDESLKGIRYRESEPGAFVVRRALDPPKDGMEATGDEIAQPERKPDLTCSISQGKEEFRFPAEIHQIGRLMTLPFNNRMFQSNALGATWDEAGRLTMISYGEKTAAAETIANLALSSVSAMRDTVIERRNEELNDLKAQNELLAARVSNAELMGKLSAPVNPNIEAIAHFNADRLLAEAETAAINAEIALNSARATQPAVP